MLSSVSQSNDPYWLKTVLPELLTSSCVLLLSVRSLERIVTCYYWGAVCRLLCRRWAPISPCVWIPPQWRNSAFPPAYQMHRWVFVHAVLFFQTTRLLASVSAFATGRMSYKSGIEMRLSLTKQISWGKSMSSSHPYHLKLFFISVSLLLSFTLLLDLGNDELSEISSDGEKKKGLGLLTFDWHGSNWLARRRMI